MKVAVQSLEDRKAVLRVEDAPASIVNAIRRALVADVPKMAINNVTIYDNTSGLFDEIIAHRLGLVPVPTDLGAFVPRDQCTCSDEGCVNCTVLYTLSKEGPGTVVSGDLTPTDPAFKVPDEKIPIVKLLEGQRLMLEAAAVLGTSRTHSKWTPVTAAGYREVPHVEIKDAPAIPPQTLAEMERTAPPGALAFEGGKVRVLDEVRAWDYLSSAKDVYGLESVHVSTEKNNWIFTVETDGSLTAKDAIQRALQFLMEKLKAVEQDVTKLKVEEESAPLA